MPGYGIAALFAKHTTIFAKRATIWRTHRIFKAKGSTICKKVPQSLDCGALQGGTVCTAIKVHHFYCQSAALLVGESGAIYVIFSSVPPRRICYILFDAYCMLYNNCMEQNCSLTIFYENVLIYIILCMTHVYSFDVRSSHGKSKGCTEIDYQEAPRC